MKQNTTHLEVGPMIVVPHFVIYFKSYELPLRKLTETSEIPGHLQLLQSGCCKLRCYS